MSVSIPSAGTDWAARRYWVFDLDGTLTCPVHDFPYIRRELGLAPQADILSELNAIADPKRRQAQYERLDELEYHYAGFAKPAPAAVELLSLLYERGCELGILTRNKRDVALHSLEAIGADKFFAPESVLGRDEAPPKPDPAGINYLLERWQGEASAGVMVGDYYFDLMAGQAAEVATVWISDKSDIETEKLANIRVSSLTVLVDLLIAPQ